MARYRDEDDFEDDERPRRSRRDEDDDRPRRRRRRDEDDEDDAPKSNGFATASLILGILSLCLGLLTGVVGVILGFIGLSKRSAKGMATAGLILSFVGIALQIAAGVFIFVQSRSFAAQKQSSNNLKQLALAEHNYNDTFGYLGGPYSRRPGEFEDQVPSDVDERLGWRVEMLPFLEQASLFRSFKLNENWNSPTNSPLSTQAIKPYSDIESPSDPNTRYRVFYGNGAAFELKSKTRFQGITDGTSNTIFAVEGGEKVTWTRFQEYKFEPGGALPALGLPNKDVFQAAMFSGEVRSFKKSIDPAVMKALITRAGGEAIPDVLR